VSALQRKRLESWREELRTRFSLVRFERKNRGIAAISRDFQDNAGRFLCASDLLVALPGKKFKGYLFSQF
jgi:hypothetical protein